MTTARVTFTEERGRGAVADVNAVPQDETPPAGERNLVPGEDDVGAVLVGRQGDGAGRGCGGRRCAEHGGGGEKNAGSHSDDACCRFGFTLTQLLHVTLPALQQLHRLRGAAVQGEMVSHTWLEVGCNRGKHIRWLMDVNVLQSETFVRFSQIWGHFWPTRLNGGVATSGSHSDPLYRAVDRARALMPFNNVTAGGVLVALPRQKEATVGVNCSGSGDRFLV